MDDKTNITDTPMLGDLIKTPAQIKAEQERIQQLERELTRKANLQKLLKRGTVIALISVVGIAVLSALIWLLILIIQNIDIPQSPPPSEPVPDEPLIERAVIEGYQCLSEKCSKITELDKKTFLVYDDSSYYIYNKETTVPLRTTIQQQDYGAITPFYWGNALYAILEPVTGRAGLYSITYNRQVGLFNYDAFHTDINSEYYHGMQWISDNYILATHDTEIRLLDTASGKEVVRAALKIFAFKPFLFGTEATGERRVYIDGIGRILISAPSDFLAVYRNHLIHVKANAKTSMDIYDEQGKKLQQHTDFYKDLRDRLVQAKAKEYALTLATFSDLFVVPN